MEVIIEFDANYTTLQSWINNEIKDKDVIDIKFTAGNFKDGEEFFAAMIIYNEK